MSLATMDTLVASLESGMQDIDISGLLESIRTEMSATTPVDYAIKAAPEKPHLEKSTLYGYAAWHKDATGNEYIDSYGDITTPGSWQECIVEWEQERKDTRRSWLIPHLYNHHKDSHVGAVMLLKEDTRGVYYESKLANTAKAQEVRTLASDGMLQCSYGYVPEQVEHVMNRKTGKLNRRLLKIHVHEISALSGFAANPYATTSLKSRDSFDLQLLKNHLVGLQRRHLALDVVNKQMYVWTLELEELFKKANS